MSKFEFSLSRGIEIIPTSVQQIGAEHLALAQRDDKKYLLIAWDENVAASTCSERFEGEIDESNARMKWCPLNAHNAQVMREILPFTAPQSLGLGRSFGAGDRLGTDAVAHINALRECGAQNRVALILAQQSMREMARTQRTPDEVLDAATWGALETNFQHAWGADADHLKTPADVQKMVEAGFTFFTIDPSEFVDDNAQNYHEAQLESAFEALPESDELRARYENRTHQVLGEDGETVALNLEFSPAVLQRAAVKYARAVAHTVQLAQLLSELKGAGNFDLEMSVDETEFPTSVEEHFFVANELKLRGVRVQSLALRFVGEFQKGVDFMGDESEFEARLREHIHIARQLGPYKISVHSGSDKFRVYPILGRVCGDLLHVKTAGTWYLEALRALAQTEAQFFREICDFARAQFPTDRATYHVIEDLRDVPDYANWRDQQLPELLDNNAARQMLHVTFGSVLTDTFPDGAWRFRDRFYALLGKHHDAHAQTVERHAQRHFQDLGWCSD